MFSCYALQYLHMQQTVSKRDSFDFHKLRKRSLYPKPGHITFSPLLLLRKWQIFTYYLCESGISSSLRIVLNLGTNMAIVGWKEKHFENFKLTFIFNVDKKNQLDVTFCILYFSSNSCSTCFGQPCAHHQELTTAWCYSLLLVCAVAAGRWSSPVGR